LGDRERGFVTEAAQANAAEKRRWNDEYWASVWPKREQMTSAVTGILLDRVGVRNGESVLDIGCGGGLTTISAGRLVGDLGTVVGADISTVLIELARRRAMEHGAAHVSFEVADVQRDTIPGMPFDVAMSQFGVMFFDEPITAFTNIRRQMDSRGRLGFACWQPIGKNPWFVGPALAAYVPTPAPPAPGKSPTGPFSLSDPERVGEILTASGWSDVAHDSQELTVELDWEAIVDDGQLSFLGVPDASLGDARQAVEEHLAPLLGADGRIHTPLAFQIFTAGA
jgi:SAM-dependent methyltransferase